tara:strand:- start:187 stop:858 length:672 start_codon:yes stop_codon:yes gene_type:complete
LSSIITIEESWHKFLSSEWEKAYFVNLVSFIKSERKAGRIIFPSGSKIFAAFEYTPVHKVRVVIIGQDPYHGHGQANGLCFSVDSKVKIPPSLRNIFKERQDDMKIPIKENGDLSHWATQGVLLLNSVLTVEKSRPGSHQNKGWEQFTDGVIKKLSDEKENLIFLLWGRFAQSKAHLVDSYKHLILKAAHPSPFSAHMGFFGCKHFSKTNKFLKNKGLPILDW